MSYSAVQFKYGAAYEWYRSSLRYVLPEYRKPTPAEWLAVQSRDMAVDATVIHLCAVRDSEVLFDRALCPLLVHRRRRDRFRALQRRGREDARCMRGVATCEALRRNWYIATTILNGYEDVISTTVPFRWLLTEPFERAGTIGVNTLHSAVLGRRRS